MPKQSKQHPKYFLGEASYISNNASKCPMCGYQLDGASGINHNDAPSPNDIGICISCASPLTYNDDLTLRVLTQAEIVELPRSLRNQIRAAMIAVRLTDRTKFKPNES